MNKEENISSSKINNPLKDYITIRQLINENRAFTEGGIRALVFHADKNGFNNCIRRIGRKILISESRFYEWIEKQNV